MTMIYVCSKCGNNALTLEGHREHSKECGGNYYSTVDSKDIRVERDPLLVEREETHGDFKKQGVWAQHIKDHLREMPQWDRMAKQQCEVLDMIVTKISRVGHGNSDHKDSWDDIAGYAKLGAEACND